MKVIESTVETMPRELEYTFEEGCFGRLLVAEDSEGICFLGYCDGDGRETLADLQRRFPKVRLRPMEPERSSGLNGWDVTFRLIGTPFQLDVWRALREIRSGERVSYAELAARIGRPSAVRAVASAVARNPIAYYVPCHRVVRSDGSTGQYHWGSARKRRMLDAERAGAISLQ